MGTNKKEYMREYMRKKLGCKPRVLKERTEGDRESYIKSKKIMCEVCYIYTLEGNMKKHEKSQQHQEKMRILDKLQNEFQAPIPIEKEKEKEKEPIKITGGGLILIR